MPVPFFKNGDAVNLKGLVKKEKIDISICTSNPLYKFESEGKEYFIAANNKDVNKTLESLRGTNHSVQISGVYNDDPGKKCKYILVNKAEHIPNITAKNK